MALAVSPDCCATAMAANLERFIKTPAGSLMPVIQYNMFVGNLCPPGQLAAGSQQQPAVAGHPPKAHIHSVSAHIPKQQTD